MKRDAIIVKVTTAGGLVGKVAKTAGDADTEIQVEIAENVEIRVLKSAITDVRSKAGAAAKA